MTPQKTVMISCKYIKSLIEISLRPSLRISMQILKCFIFIQDDISQLNEVLLSKRDQYLTTYQK